VDSVDWVILAIVWSVTFGLGAMSILRGRVLSPWRRGRIRSPRAWGAGYMLMGIAATIGIITHGRSETYRIMAAVLAFSSCGLMLWSQRSAEDVGHAPGRPWAAIEEVRRARLDDVQRQYRLPPSVEE